MPKKVRGVIVSVIERKHTDQVILDTGVEFTTNKKFIPETLIGAEIETEIDEYEFLGKSHITIAGNYKVMKTANDKFEFGVMVGQSLNLAHAECLRNVTNFDSKNERHRTLLKTKAAAIYRASLELRDELKN